MQRSADSSRCAHRLRSSRRDLEAAAREMQLAAGRELREPRHVGARRSRRSSGSRRWSGDRPSARSAARSPAPAPCRGRSARIVSHRSAAAARAAAAPPRRKPMRFESAVMLQIVSKKARCAARVEASRSAAPSMTCSRIGSRSGSVSGGADQRTLRPLRLLEPRRSAPSTAPRRSPAAAARRRGAASRPRSRRSCPGR